MVSGWGRTQVSASAVVRIASVILIASLIPIASVILIATVTPHPNWVGQDSGER